MKTRTRRRTAGALAVLILSAFFSQTAAAESASETVVFVSPALTRTTGNLARPYTREEILNAKPIPLPVFSTSHAAKANDGTPALESAARDEHVITIPSGLPDPRAEQEAQRAFPDQRTLLKQARTSEVKGEETAPAQPGEVPPGLDDSAVVDTADHPFTMYWGNYYKPQHQTFPWKAVGKLMFRDGSSTYFGTAQVIFSPGGNLIVTAAHNVWNYNTKSPFEDLTFIPAERDGAKPYGEFKFKTARVLRRWIEGNSPNRDDVALLTLQNNSDDKPVSFYTGWLGLKMNLSYTLNLTAIGYAGNNASDGKWTTITNGQSFSPTAEECPGLPGSEDILFIGSPLGKGASGGAWLHEYNPYNPKEGNYVVSVVSGGVLCGEVKPLDNILLGPRFSEANIGVLCAYEGCKP